MDSDAVRSQFSLIETVPPSADLHLAAEPVQPTTPSHSPARRQRLPQHEIDSFLANLEPGFILEALVATSKISPEHIRGKGLGKHGRRDFITETVANASPPERVWGIKAARAGKSIREWHDELADWPWPKKGQCNGFQAQYNEDQLAKTLPPAGREGYRASMPSSQIGAYETRVEAIRKDLGMLELEDLKGYVRDVHVTPNSKRTSFQTPAEAASYDHLDDFTALITATIVQSLPVLARLNSLTNAWSLRLVIMRLVPDFLRDMASCKDSMLSAQMAIGTPTSQTPMGTPGSMTSKQKKSFSRNVFGDMQAVLKDQISETGKKLDAMLDLLEGSMDVLPEHWIDSMDELEKEHTSWAVKAEEVVLDNELDQARADSTGEESLAGLTLAPRGSQYLQISADDARALSSLSDGSDTGALGVKSLEIPTISTDTETNQRSSTQSTAVSSIQNYSNGVRKPTGAPEDMAADSAEPAAATKLSPLVIEKSVSAVESNATSDHISSASRSGSIDSDYLSIGSSPEIQSATFAAYPGSPIQVTTPSSSRLSVDLLNISKQPDLYDRKTRQSWSGVSLDPRSLANQRKRSSTFTASPSPSPSRESFLHARHAVSRFTPNYARPRSASIKSFEVVPRSEVRTIEVRRSISHASTEGLSRPDLEGMPSPRGSAMGRLEGHESDVPASKSEASLPSLTMAQDRFASGDLSTEPYFNSRPQTPEMDPAQISFAKTRDQFGTAASSSDLILKTVGQQRAATVGNLATTYHTKAPLPKNGDRLDAKISSILTKIPADIRLTSATETTVAANTTKPSNAATSKTSNLRRVSVSRLIRSRTSTPTLQPMTLAPAPASPPSEPRSNSSEIKLYHLHQPGSAYPVKLYIRLVGETGERVMVRVGGGWADLAEYLKEYASRHRQRAVSDSRFNVQNIPQTSSPAAAVATSSSRPSSSSSNAFLRRQQSTPAGEFPSPPRTPPFGFGPPGLRPSSSRGTWSGNSDEDGPSLGLAGPKSRNVNISPRKQAWVDGMMRQARETSGGERGKEGRVGSGVKRVFLGIGGRKESL